MAREIVFFVVAGTLLIMAWELKREKPLVSVGLFLLLTAFLAVMGG